MLTIQYVANASYWPFSSYRPSDHGPSLRANKFEVKAWSRASISLNWNLAPQRGSLPIWTKGAKTKTFDSENPKAAFMQLIVPEFGLENLSATTCCSHHITESESNHTLRSRCAPRPESIFNPSTSANGRRGHTAILLHNSDVIERTKLALQILGCCALTNAID